MGRAVHLGDSSQPASLAASARRPRSRSRREHKPGAAIHPDRTRVSNGPGTANRRRCRGAFPVGGARPRELAAAAGRSRAFFVEGLCSSYEAFRHNRDAGSDTRDVDDEGVEHAAEETKKSSAGRDSIVPIPMVRGSDREAHSLEDRKPRKDDTRIPRCRLSSKRRSDCRYRAKRS